MKLTAENKAAKLHNIANALNSHCVQHSILSTVNRELDKWGGLQPQDWRGEEAVLTINSYGSYDKLYVNVSVADESLYEQLSNSPLTGMDITEMKAYYKIENVLVDYDISCDIQFSFACPLPEEDLQVLKMLGKVKYDEGYIRSPEAYIDCEVPVDYIPF